MADKILFFTTCFSMENKAAVIVELFVTLATASSHREGFSFTSKLKMFVFFPQELRYY